MNTRLTILGAVGALAALALAGSANATVTTVAAPGTYFTPDQTYELSPYDLQMGTTSSATATLNVPAGKSRVYDFTFGITGDSANASAFGSFGFGQSGQNVTDANLQLYQDNGNGNYTFITGLDYDPATDPQQSIVSDLTTGNYFVQTKISTTGGDGSTPTTFSATIHRASAAPEPSTWLLMMMGVGGLGLALRSRRQGAGSLRLA